MTWKAHILVAGLRDNSINTSQIYRRISSIMKVLMWEQFVLSM